MTELNLKCHYQMVLADTSHGEEFTVHEAFSTDKGELYMICPVPVYIMGDSKEDISELACMVEKDIERYPLVNITDIQHALDRYIDYTNEPIEVIFEPDFSDDNLLLDSDDNILDDGYDDSDDKVLDLVEFMNKRR